MAFEIRRLVIDMHTVFPYLCSWFVNVQRRGEVFVLLNIEILTTDNTMDIELSTGIDI